MNICLYGASSNVIDEKYILNAEKVGRLIAERGHRMVFGGGAQGVMGGAARGVTAGGGELIGVAPGFFNVDGILYEKCTEFVYTETMRERKQIMEDRADAFIVMPGGIGTFEEFFEILTLKQLGRHCKAIAVFSDGGYYTELASLIEKTIQEKFMKEECRDLCKFFDNAEEMMDYLESYEGSIADVKHMKNI